MKYQSVFNIFLSLSLLSAMFSCCDNLPVTHTDEIQLPITLSAAYPSATRASDSGFEEGDQMGLYVLDYVDGQVQNISGNDVKASNIRFEFDGTDNSWKGIRDLYWSGSNIPADIIAYYPYIPSISDPEAVQFSVSHHQETAGSEFKPGGYESSDFLWGANIKQMPTSEKVDLTLRHILAGVRVSLKEGTGFTSGEWSELDKNVVIPSTVTSGTINLRDGAVTAGTGNAESIVPMEYNGDFRCVVFPQTVAPGSSLVSISVGSAGYNLIKQEPTDFIMGKLHAFTITVNKKNGGEYEFTVSDEAVIPWLDGADFRDGVIRSYTSVEVKRRGSLKDILMKEGITYKELSNLKLFGEINETDLFFMRDEMESLKNLNLKDVRVYDGNRIDVIPARAMYRKASLARIVFPEKLKIIGTSAFQDSGLMGDLIIPEGVEKIGEYFDSEGTWWEHPLDIGSVGVFSNCHNLMGELSLPSSLTHIEHGAFTYDQFEGALKLPENLQFIGDFAFYSNNFTGELKIPENVVYIGSGAFGKTKFSGSLEIPSGIEILKRRSFEEVSFSGSLLLPDGIHDIQMQAFYGCGFRGELLLPSSLRTLGNYAFCNTNISSIIFPENLTSIGKGCFMNCKSLNEKIVIPKNVNRINEYAFAGDILLNVIELHENVSYVAGCAFAEDYNLAEIISMNPEPPVAGIVTDFDWANGVCEDKGPFYGIQMSNLTLKVPESSREAYSRASVWKNIGRHATFNGFGCRPEKICALNNSHVETLIVNAEDEWEITHIPIWCKISKSSGKGKTQLTVTISEMTFGTGNREDYIEFQMKGTEFTTRCRLSQFDYRYEEDECVSLQKASKGNGIDILFLADGFDAESIAGGEYLNLVNEHIEAFFGVEPYSTYRDRFNVYACVTLSQETGVNTTSTSKNTKFLTRFDNGTGCSDRGLACNDPDEVFDYAVAHSPLKRDKMAESTIIMVLNSDEYGSATELTDNGSAIAIIGCSSEPYPMDTRGMLQHEACGHAFGKLAEERIMENRYVTDKEKKDINKCFLRGWYQNISLSGKMNEVNWADLIFDPRYSNSVDVFEGGYGVTRGVYRAEINSCMNYGIPYFSAAARLDIMRRILEYSGEGFSMEKFYATDSDKWGATGSTRAAIPSKSENYINSGMHHPVRIIKSKKY